MQIEHSHLFRVTSGTSKDNQLITYDLKYNTKCAANHKLAYNKQSYFHLLAMLFYCFHCAFPVSTYLQDSCVRQSLRCARLTRLLTLQLHLLKSGHKTRLINLDRENLMEPIMALPRFYQVCAAEQLLILSFCLLYISICIC